MSDGTEKLNLKKARRLESKLEDFIESKAFHSMRENISTNGGFDAFLKKADAKAKEQEDAIKIQQELITLRYSIRQRIAEQNEKTGLSFKISLRAALVNMIEHVYQPLAKLTPRASSEDLVEAFDELQARRTKNTGYVENTLTVNLFTREKIEQHKDNLLQAQQRLERMDDEISGINLNNYLVFDVEEVKLLRGLRLL